MVIRISSAAFEPGEPIPKHHTGEGSDASPPLAWSDLPAGTQELALICDDPDAPSAHPWVHWVLYKLPPTLKGLREEQNGGGLEGMNDFGNTGYGGPLPPRGHGAHHYHFRVYALDQPLGLAAGASKPHLVAAMAGHILDEGEIVGTYERK